MPTSNVLNEALPQSKEYICKVLKTLKKRDAMPKDWSLSSLFKQNQKLIGSFKEAQ